MASHLHRPARPRRPIALLGALCGLALLGSGCSLIGEDDSSSGGGSAGDDPGTGSGEVVLVTHDSFSLPKRLVRAFEQESGYTLVQSPAGDGGELTSKLQLTEGDPLGDVAFGVDNTFAGSVLGADVFAPTTPTCRPAPRTWSCPATTRATGVSSPRSTPATSASTSTPTGSRRRGWSLRARWTT
ncbi:type 2 periplasmic-binding domain-containing protein [Nocardioides sambongensis]|uniref:hypothetical protein n=1 Tax=Nocardioides sambongensis TaxID=2589074 RepID=UPI001E40CB1D|nr:hypothetical protein [Nocardioides sambongensis]